MLSIIGIFLIALSGFLVPFAGEINGVGLLPPMLSPESSFSRSFSPHATSPEDLPPEIVLPDLRNLPPSDLRLTYDPVSGGKLIRFTTEIWNSGPGILELHGYTDDYTGRIMVEQQLFNVDREWVSSVEVGEFVYHPQHDHMHLDGFALYEVWSLTDDFKLDQVAASGGKISYCVMDVVPVRTDASNDLEEPGDPVYIDCSADFQGLSPGWVDRYEYSLPDQWVDISVLQNGIYALVITVNPDQNTQEINMYNNRGITYFSLEDWQVRELGAFLSSGLLRE